MATTATITVNSLEGRENVKVIHVTGELDESNLPEFEAAISPLALDPKVQLLIFNFMGLKYMNSKIVGYFAYLYTTLSRNQRRIIFACYNQNIRDIITLVGLDKLVESSPTLEDAIQTAYELTQP